MLSRKKRDAKFLIFQSLYLIAIAILFYKGTDLSLDKVEKKDPTKISIDSNFKPYDPNIDTVLTKLTDDAEYKSVLPNQTIVSRDSLGKLDKRIKDLEAQKTPPREEKKREEEVKKGKTGKWTGEE